MMPFWDMFGNTVASVNYIRLTSDTQGLHGGICNVVVCLICLVSSFSKSIFMFLANQVCQLGSSFTF